MQEQQQISTASLPLQTTKQNAYFSLATGSADSHLSIVYTTPEGEEKYYAVEHLCSIEGFGAKAREDAFKDVDLIKLIGMAKLQETAKKFNIQGLIIGGAAGHILKAKTFNKIEGGDREKEKVLTKIAGKESPILTRELARDIKALTKAATSLKGNSGWMVDQVKFTLKIYASTQIIFSSLNIRGRVRVGIKGVGDKHSDGYFAADLALENNCSVMDMGGGRGNLFEKNGKKPTNGKIEVETNALFPKGTYIGKTSPLFGEYIEKMKAFFEQHNITSKKRVLMLFTGMARNSKDVQFLEDLKEALVKKGFYGIEPNYLDLDKEGRLEAKTLASFLNKHQQHTKLGKILLRSQQSTQQTSSKRAAPIAPPSDDPKLAKTSTTTPPSGSLFSRDM